MKVKILSFLLLIILVASCDKYSREKYPKLVSKIENYQYINNCYSAEFENLDKIPTEIQDKINSYYNFNRVGSKYMCIYIYY